MPYSYEEAGRYLETYKAYENKPPDLLMERVDSDFTSRVRPQMCMITPIYFVPVCGELYSQLCSIVPRPPPPPSFSLIEFSFLLLVLQCFAAQAVSCLLQHSDKLMLLPHAIGD